MTMCHTQDFGLLLEGQGHNKMSKETTGSMYSVYTKGQGHKKRSKETTGSTFSVYIKHHGHIKRSKETTGSVYYMNGLNLGHTSGFSRKISNKLGSSNHNKKKPCHKLDKGPSSNSKVMT